LKEATKDGVDVYVSGPFAGGIGNTLPLRVLDGLSLWVRERIADNWQFDNVGGEILDLMLGNMSMYGRIAACGAVSGYNSDEPTVLKNYFQVITMRLQLKGFIVLDYLSKAGDTLKLFRQAIQEGKLKIGDENETVVSTRFEDVPKTWLKLFSGENTGKLVTKIDG
jgi:NADPH-dependent curcumin reductase CurA